MLTGFATPHYLEADHVKQKWYINWTSLKTSSLISNHLWNCLVLNVSGWIMRLVVHPAGTGKKTKHSKPELWTVTGGCFMVDQQHSQSVPITLWSEDMKIRHTGSFPRRWTPLQRIVTAKHPQPEKITTEKPTHTSTVPYNILATATIICWRLHLLTITTEAFPRYHPWTIAQIVDLTTVSVDMYGQYCY